MNKDTLVTKDKIWLSPPHMSGYEQEFIDDAFRSNWIAPLGPNVSAFEKQLENYLENNVYVTALTTGTAAIHLALKLLNIATNDVVLCQTKTFAASVNPVIYQGATPVFIDSESSTWNMCPNLLEKAIKTQIKKQNKPKAIITISLYGMPYNVNDIHAISTKYNIPVIEDSAEALGSMYNGQKCGTFGDYSIISFNGNKIITTSGGGVLISKNSATKKQAIYLATQAKDEGLEYSHSAIGYNYRMSNILAGIGRGQMQVLDKYVDLRRRNFNYYKTHLKHIDEIAFLEEPKGYFSNRWLTCIVLNNKKTRDDLLHRLLNENIEARPSWKPMHLQPVFKKYNSFLNGVSEEIYHTGLCLPSGSSLTKSDLNRIINVIKTYFGKA